MDSCLVLFAIAKPIRVRIMNMCLSCFCVTDATVYADMVLNYNLDTPLEVDNAPSYVEHLDDESSAPFFLSIASDSHCN
ncbi:hypothetical protein RB195_025927 [Necator americanus]|uniref:Uncharacterized protein n=1 Tax=Necator americanus TaxID=51031 RepID=A0ABR1EUK9_NECAM